MAEVKYDPILGKLREKDGNGGGGGTGGDLPPDNETITVTPNDTIQAIAVRDSNNNAARRIWTGTYEQYTAQNKAASDDICIVTDDDPTGAAFVQQSEKGAANGVAALDANGKLVFSQMPTLMLDSAPTSSTAGHLTQQAFVESTGKCYQLIGIDDTDPQDVVYTWAECINSSNLPTIPPATLILNAAPTTSTVGILGQPALDTTTQKTYKCTAVTNTGTEAEPVWSYTWTDDVNAKGGTFAARTGVSGSGGFFVGGGDPGSGGISIGSGVCTNWYGIAGHVCSAHGYSIAFGQNVHNSGKGAAFGKFSTLFKAYNSSDSVFLLNIGNGNDSLNRRNALELSVDRNNLYIVGGFQQESRVIPNATTAYTLEEGVQQHTPDAASTYTLPMSIDALITEGYYFTRNAAGDGTGYYAWKDGTMNRYTASPKPVAGTDKAYTNTALTANAKDITFVYNRTHECILDVLFTGYSRSTSDDGTGYYAWKDTKGNLLYTATDAPTAGTTEAYTDTALSTSAGVIALYDSASSSIAMVGTYSFEDSSGNTITPLSTPTIKPGTIISFLCEWSSLDESWTIMPLVTKEGL